MVARAARRRLIRPSDGEAMQRLVTLLLAFLASVPALGQEHVSDPRLPADLATDERAHVTAVIDGDTVALDDGTEVRLVGLQAPKLPLGRPGFVAWPGASAARDALAALVDGQTVTLAYGGNRLDRHGRRLAHLVREDGLWVQGRMLAAGQARVYTFPDNTAAAAEMLALEEAARAAGRGIWSDPFYAVRTPAETGQHIDTFQLVEGRVLQAAEVRGRIYLNFGEDWREDFTVTIAPSDTDRFADAHPNPLSLAGTRVRVRGWLYWFNGPAIDLTHPAQLEPLEPSDDQ